MIAWSLITDFHWTTTAWALQTSSWNIRVQNMHINTWSFIPDLNWTWRTQASQIASCDIYVYKTCTWTHDLWSRTLIEHQRHGHRRHAVEIKRIQDMHINTWPLIPDFDWTSKTRASQTGSWDIRIQNIKWTHDFLSWSLIEHHGHGHRRQAHGHPRQVVEIYVYRTCT